MANSNIHGYRFLLNIPEATPEQMLEFEKAFNETELVLYMKRTKFAQDFFASERAIESDGSHEEMVEQELHELALKFPNLTLNFTCQDLDAPNNDFVLRLKNNTYRRANVVSVMSDLSASGLFEHRRHANLTELDRQQVLIGSIKDLLHRADFDLIHAQKQILLSALETGKTPPKEAINGLVDFLNQMEDIGVTMGCFQQDGIEPPFPLQADYVKKEYTFEEKPERMYLLCEEHDNREDPVDFTVLAASRDEAAIKKLMAAKVAKDEHGLFAANGVYDQWDTHVFSEYGDEGEIKYFILEEPVLSKEQAEALLNTPEYNSEFIWPDNIREHLTNAVDTFLIRQGYPILDSDKAVDALLIDEGFRKLMKGFHFSPSALHDNEGNCHIVESETNNYLRLFTAKYPEWLEDIGAVRPFVYPSNLRDILVDVIYDISKELHLGVHKAEGTALAILNSPEFRRDVMPNLFEYGSDPVKRGSSEYETIMAKCYDNVVMSIVPQEMITGIPVPFNTLISEAQNRASSQAQPNNQQTEKQR